MPWKRERTGSVIEGLGIFHEENCESYAGSQMKKNGKGNLKEGENAKGRGKELRVLGGGGEIRKGHLSLRFNRKEETQTEDGKQSLLHGKALLRCAKRKLDLL